MTKASDNEFPSLLVKEGTAPSSPAAGDQRVYIDSTSHKLTRKNSSGTVTVIEGISDTGTIATYVDLTDQGSDPSSPSAGNHRFYAKSGGLYVKDSSATVVGALGAGGGGSLTSAMNQLSGDVTITAGTWADGPTLTVAAGTYLLIAAITIDFAGGAISAECRIYDGTTTYASIEGFMDAATAAVPLSCSAIATVGGSTTFKAQGNSSSTSSKIKAAIPHNGAGNNASTLIAIKIA